MKTLSRSVAAAALALGLTASAAGQASPDEKAVMEAWQRAMTPGPGQKKLEPMVGTFDTKVRTWMEPGKPPEDTVGTSVNTWVLGNRYVQTQYEGVFLGEAFNGIGYTGYDNVSKKYVSVWMDTASTGMMVGTGSFDATGKVITLKMSVSDPVSGKQGTAEEKVTIVDDDHHTLELWTKGRNGKTFKMMEIQYSRKK
jgi:hypothetical protein